MKKYLLLIVTMLMAVSVSAQTPTNIRYVSASTGKFTNDGTSWATAKNNIQDAINDLVNNNLSGEVWVAEGTYYPTESTESSSSPYYKAFKIPAGITVRGGFAGSETALDQRAMKNDNHFGQTDKSGTLDGEASKSGRYLHETILCGDLSATKKATLKFNATKQQFDVAFYGNSYHVVWFAMNGFDSEGRALPLGKPAKLEGCIIEGGHAFSNDLSEAHPHVAYGGGIYMVANSFVYNCEVRNCDASRNGGGIYMDGGGIVRRTYVHKCQALGIGTDFGMGGGICEEGSVRNSKSNPIVVAQSVVLNCVGRLGGGVGINAEKIPHASRFTAVINSTVVNNNTATIEGGGVYTYKGGGVASGTIVRNRCNGSGVTLGGAITGRSGGLYSRDAAYVGNTVIWGNECVSNNDTQYATSRIHATDTEKSHFYYNALSKSDNTDWSQTEKMGVLSLADENNTTVDAVNGIGFPLFFKPTASAGYLEAAETDNTIDWQTSSESFLTYAGISTVDLDYEGLTPAPTGKSYDIRFGEFNARPSIGAICSQVADIAPAENVTYDGDTYTKAFFVDPSFIYKEDNPSQNGVSWTTPARFLGLVLDYIADQNYDPETESVAIFVKEGTVDNTRIQGSTRVRETSLEIPSNVTIIGSFSSKLTDTQVNSRNPIQTPTVISGQMMNDYKFNIAHLINIYNKQNITIDGFKLTLANAHSTELNNSNTNGAAITLKNCAKEGENVTIHFKNITISNCYGDKGTVVYSDNASADFENCIFHNNSNASVNDNGLIYGINSSDLRFNHCNVLRNVGHASYLDATTKNQWKNTMFYGNLHRASENTNSCDEHSALAFEGPGAVPANLTGERCMFDRRSYAAYDAGTFNLGAGIPSTSTYHQTNNYPQGTQGINDPNIFGHDIHYGLNYVYQSGLANGYPRMVNPTKNAGYSTDGDVTYYGRATSFEPHNDNPVVNAASTGGEPHSARQWGTDLTTYITRDYGGLPDIGAVESHVASADMIASENGNPDGQMPYGVAYYVRDYSQDDMLPTYNKDAEGNYTLADDHKGTYVKEGDDYVFLDGASWQYAVNGNATYGELTTRDVNATFVAKEETPGGTRYETFIIQNQGRGRYMYINNGAFAFTTNSATATKWTVSETNTTDGTFTAGTHTISAKVGNTTYYLSFSGNNPVLSTSSATVYLVANNSYWRIRQPNGTRYYYMGGNTSISGSTTTNTYSSWTFSRQATSVAPTYAESHNPSDATANTEKNVAQNQQISESIRLHVYESLDDFTKLGANAVTYKIAQLAPGSGSATYLSTTNNTYYYAIASAAQSAGHTYAIISAKEEDKYYIYDVTNGRWLYNYNDNNTPVRETATLSNRTAWYIVESATDNRFNIMLGSGNSMPSTGWNKGGTYVNLAARTGSSAQWVLEAQKDYTPYKYQLVEGGINGLQYAVNTVHNEFLSTHSQYEVHVAQGTYTNKTGVASDPDNAKNVVKQPYAYMMQEGVNVLGGYPLVGNPGEDQRQPKLFETILQPQTESPFITMAFGSHNGTQGGLSYKPDIMAVSNWGSCANNTNTDKESVGRVLVQPENFDVETAWDGFTLRHGYLNTGYLYAIGNALTVTSGTLGIHPDDNKVAGGAGVLLQGNGMLVNSKVTDNLIVCVPSRSSNPSHTSKIRAAGYVDANNETTPTLDTYNIGGAGVFMTGDNTRTATIENCEIGKNQAVMKAVHIGTTSFPDHIWVYGAGLFQNGGNVYNTILHDNFAGTIQGKEITNMSTGTGNNEMILGAGAFVFKGNFYNNTVVNNQSCTFYHRHDNHCTFAGIHVANEARIYNSLISDNESYWGYKTWNALNENTPGNGVPVCAFKDDETTRSSRDPGKVHVFNSFVNVKKGLYTLDSGKTIWVDLTSGATSGNGATNIYIDSNGGVNLDNTTYTDQYAPEYRTNYTKGVYYMSGANQYRLIAGSPCINGGTEAVKDADDNDVTIPEFDAGYEDRIQDCRIDIGAYEYDGTATIHPHMLKKDGTAAANIAQADRLVFYVTPEGYGDTSASDPANAACASKLQKVIDAAGRYKLQNPGKQVIVKVANCYDLQREGSDFTYYATRTSDQSSTDTRLWSTIIPRGVEVWGGYTDKNSDASEWTNSKNGFQERDITKYPTYFDSYFYNKDMKINATTYHVVTFTERIYDVDGNPYLAADYDSEHNTLAAKSSYSGERDEALFLHMSNYVEGNVIMDGENPKNFGTNENPIYASNRAVLDGIFVTGGNADGKAISGSANLNANGYGGAAIVTDYAYVRNCIVTGNNATNGGGLALTGGALVSGSLIIENNAHNQGGGLYIFEHGATLSNGITISTNAPDGQNMDYNMSHVLTTTIVQNKAQQGGGVWFSNTNPNTRIISTAIWQNSGNDQKNVFGLINPEQPTEDETDSEVYYPFSYSAIESLRASGSDNMSLESLNKDGVRFVKEDYDFGGTYPTQNKVAKEGIGESKYDEFKYYGLTHYSVLCSSGMPVSKYNEMFKAIAISDVDFLGQPRVADEIKFVEIGARALAKQMPNKQLMLRLFVAQPKDVDTDKAIKFMEMETTAGSAEEYYSQVGSSFAYPFNTLQDALDYIKDARDGKIDPINGGATEVTSAADAQNLPFEILVGRGTYYPQKDLNGDTKSVWAHTFAIPEGVTIIGGFNPQGGENTYYGRYYKKGANYSTATNIYDAVDPIPSTVAERTATEIGRGNKYGTENITLDGDNITFQQWHIQDIADRRAMADNNKNGIIEPWEFANQTIISGNAVNGETDGVYHVMTAVSDEDAVGRLPKVQRTNSEFVGSTVNEETGYQWKEEGQQIRLNGLIVTGGNALTYLSTALDEYGKYIFYQGAGLQVDGNRYKNNSGDVAVFHNSAAYGVGYRDIPVSVTNCQFRNNVAGYGGAISTNGSLSLFGSSFEQNMAIAQTEMPEDGETWTTDVDPSNPGQNVLKVMYPGQGGAILATRQLSAFNTLFANNEARLADGEPQTIGLVTHPTFRVPDEGMASATLRAAGGAIMMGSAAEHHIVNCNFVRNKANAYPAVFTMNPTFDQDEDVNTHDYSQIINTVAWGNEVNPDMLAKFPGNKNYQFASKLLVNVGKKNRSNSYVKSKSNRVFYDPKFEGTNTPTSQADLDNDANQWQEAVWFCAYEDGTGFTPHNENDLRDAIVYTAGKYAPWMIKQANGDTYQNCNILLTADNKDVAGPNFGNPSAKAGYDGFMEGADWSPARYNALTDNGNGWIRQSVDNATLDVTFYNDNGYYKNGSNADAGYNYQGAYCFTHYISDLTQPNPQFPEYKLWLALGNEKYMQATNDPVIGTITINGTAIATPQRNLPRISPDPTLGVEKAYIDIGMFEYYKQPLLKPGSEVDILWVSTKEKPENGPATGATWMTPTSDLQRAIETLLSSRNGHKKEIRIMEGEYTPIKTQTISGQKYNAFVIDNQKMNQTAIVPAGFTDNTNNDQYFAQSLTIKGGYSADIMYEYDPVQYKTVIRQKDAPTGISSDHLFYVADPIVRYYYPNDTRYAANNNGATFSIDEGNQSHIARTMPIQIDGLTLINDKAQTAGTKGSAIYYPNVSAGTGSHTVSVNGTVTYYQEKEMNNVSSTETEFVQVGAGDPKQNPAKLVITKSQIIGSGKVGDTEAGASAVFIGENGGSALIYNTVFHSNQGMPLDAQNTVSINNTFAKNLGQVKLTGDGSEMHNSVMWQNAGSQQTLPSGDKFTYNAYTGGEGAEDGNHNIGLVAQNGNIAEGPNFVNPDQGGIEALSFDIKPSARLLNQGEDASLTSGTGKYFTKIVNEHYDYALVSTTLKDVLYRERLNAPKIDRGAYEFQGQLSNILYVDPNKSHRDDAQGLDWSDAFGYGDLQSAVDLASLSIGVGQPKSYVFVKGASATNKGLNTNETLTLRNGVSVYGSVNAGYTDYHNMLKSGSQTDMKFAKAGDPTEFDIDAFISNLLEVREGVASSSANKTTVKAIKTADEAGAYTDNAETLVDGFVVTDPGTPTSPVVDITNSSKDALIALRNIIVTGNDMSNAGAGTNVAQLNNGLLYEALFYGNKQAESSYTLKVGQETYSGNPNYTTNGYAVNVTVEGDVCANDRTDIVDDNNTHIYNSIVNSIHSTDGNAAYGNINNRYISGYYYNIADAALNYQLTENSKYIDQCEATNPVAGTKYASFINYQTDRDLLGNPRLLAGVTAKGKLDRGAFETWQVDNSFTCGDQGTIGTSEAGYTDAKYAGIKKQFYPHDGSVVYIMKGKSLVIDPVDAEHEVKPTPHNPGFMLLQEGASCYGSGRPMTCAYLAVERFVRKGGEVLSMPYAMRYMTDVAHPSYDSQNVLSLTKASAEAYSYNAAARADWQYDFKSTQSPCWEPMSVASAATANNGVLYVPSDDMISSHGEKRNGSAENTHVLLRFTGKGNSLTDYIYTEQANTTDGKKNISKTVALTQYNDGGRQDGSGANGNTADNADITDANDMGWNAIGLPYLVSDYKPYNTVDVNAGTGIITVDGSTVNSHPYQMNIPHTMWMYYDGSTYSDGTTQADGDGGFYSVSSWTYSDWHLPSPEQARIWVGEGFFTQTATFSGSEDLTFYRPVAPAKFGYTAPTPARTSLDEDFGNSRYYVTTDIRPEEEHVGKQIVATRYFTPDGIQHQRPVRGVTIQVDIYDDGSRQTMKYMRK